MRVGHALRPGPHERDTAKELLTRHGVFTICASKALRECTHTPHNSHTFTCLMCTAPALMTWHGTLLHFTLRMAQPCSSTVCKKVLTSYWRQSCSRDGPASAAHRSPSPSSVLSCLNHWCTHFSPTYRGRPLPLPHTHRWCRVHPLGRADWRAVLGPRTCKQRFSR